MANPTCPECGATMRPFGRGATLRKRGPVYICPAAEAEETRDERGRLHWPTNSIHGPYLRTWSADQLQSAREQHSQPS